MNIKPLSFDQYEEARGRAVERVKARIGDRPTRRQFQREYGAVVTVLDWIALVVFLAALVISSAHIIQYMKAQAVASYEMDNYAAGVIIGQHLYSMIHEIGAIFLAEAAAILFMTMHSMGGASRAARAWYLRWFSIPLVLAVVAAVFVFAANISSGVNALVSVMPPLFTLGIAVRLEAIIVTLIKRDQEVTRRYEAALTIYEAASANPETHPEFARVLKQTIWEKLISLPSNKPYKDAPPAFKAAAVRREMERDTWTDHAGDQAVDWTPEPDERPMTAPRGRQKKSPIGSSVPESDDAEDTQPIEPQPLQNEAERTGRASD